MHRLLVVCSLAAAAGAVAFRGDPGDASILAEKRNHHQDGSIDVAYAQEDGVLFKETTNSDGERRGSYSYVGDDGKKYNVEYVAGKSGFRIINSGHIAKTPDLPVGEPTRDYDYDYQPEPRPEKRRQHQQQHNVVRGNKFNIQYELSQTASPPTVRYEETATQAWSTTTRRTTTTTTTPWPRRNYHTGEVNLKRDDTGYTYSYRHTG